MVTDDDDEPRQQTEERDDTGHEERAEDRPSIICRDQHDQQPDHADHDGFRVAQRCKRRKDAERDGQARTRTSRDPERHCQDEDGEEDAEPPGQSTAGDVVLERAWDECERHGGDHGAEPCRQQDEGQVVHRGDRRDRHDQRHEPEEREEILAGHGRDHADHVEPQWRIEERDARAVVGRLQGERKPVVHQVLRHRQEEPTVAQGEIRCRHRDDPDERADDRGHDHGGDHRPSVVVRPVRLGHDRDDSAA